MDLVAREWLTDGDRRFAHLSPSAPLAVAFRAVLAAWDWQLCARLYGHVLACGLQSGRLQTADVLSLSVANARLVRDLWPERCAPALGDGLAAVAAYARGEARSRRTLAVPRSSVISARDALAGQAADRAALRAVDAVAAVMRAAAGAHCKADLVRAAVRVVTWAETASAEQVVQPHDRGEQRARRRLAVWRPAFLFLDLALQ